MQENTSLLNLNTFHIDEEAQFFSKFKSKEELIDLITLAKEKSLPIKVLGGGSNILLTKKAEGLVLKNELRGIEIVEENKQEVKVKFEAGENWHNCVLWAIENNLGGIENLALIPGTIGAAPIQNIGAYGMELKDVFFELEALEIDTLETKKFTKQYCEFNYRSSVFKTKLKEKFIITSVILCLHKNHTLHLNYGTINDVLNEKNCTKPTIKDVANAVIEIRKSKLPNPDEIGNAGSFFKNAVVNKTHFEKIYDKNKNMPYFILNENEVKIPTAWLVEQCGWKGFREKDFGVHAKQALVLVNYNKSNGNDIFLLSAKIIESVNTKFGIELEREVNIW
jgi:UDP-N-acetylmuramate dehydrogenase